MRIESFTQEYLAPAAALGAAHFRGLRETLPLLPERYTRVETLLPLLQPAAETAHGVVALEGDDLLGYMVDARFEFKGQQTAMSPEWAHATLTQDARRINEALYTALSRQWVADGRNLHLIAWTPNDVVAQKVWFWQGFGLLGADGLRDLTPIEGAACKAAIRRATVDDTALLQQMGRGLTEHMAATPTFLAGHAESVSSWHDKLADESMYVAIAELDAKPLGYLRIGPASNNACIIIRDPGTASITGAFVTSEARGMGVGQALLDACLRFAGEQGYARCAVDFESANLPATRFWLRHFQPVVLAGMRFIDPRAQEKLAS